MIYKCVNCGGNVVFDPQSGHMKCLSCGGSDCEQSIPSETPMICPSCGSQITYRNEYGSAGKCPACGTFLIRDDFVVYPYGPDMILPFKFSKHLAEEKLKEEFGKKLFLPADFLSTKTLEKLRGVYVPFWIYDFDSNVDYTAIGTKVRTWTSGDRRYTETSYFDVYRKLHIKYNGIPVDASVEMPDGIMDLMEPYGYDALLKHDNKFMSGFEAEVYNYTPDQLSGRAVKKINDTSMEWAKSEASGYNSLLTKNMNANNQLLGNKFALMPVWIYEYRYKGQNYMFYVNGQTGKCVGTPPRSVSRAIGLTAAFAASVAACASGIAMLLEVL